jgi:hypothetical protein
MFNLFLIQETQLVLFPVVFFPFHVSLTFFYAELLLSQLSSPITTIHLQRISMKESTVVSNQEICV